MIMIMMILQIENNNTHSKHTALNYYPLIILNIYIYLPSKVQWKHVKNIFLVRLQPLLDMDRWCLYVL